MPVVDVLMVHLRRTMCMVRFHMHMCKIPLPQFLKFGTQAPAPMLCCVCVILVFDGGGGIPFWYMHTNVHVSSNCVPILY